MLDFGIAKLLDAGVSNRQGEQALERERTLTHRRAMTLSHASPEPVLGQAVTTATDVYGLGLILYEILCGVAPFALDADSTYELLRLICEQQTQSPSTLIKRLADEDAAIDPQSLREVAGQRDMDPARLSASLAGDLDAVVVMALRKEPEKRCASVAELGNELGRHLDDRPVRSRTTAICYRIGKLLRRNRAVAIVHVLPFVTATARTDPRPVFVCRDLERYSRRPGSAAS